MTIKPCAIAYINDAGECEQIDWLPSDLEGDPDSTSLVRQADAEDEIARIAARLEDVLMKDRQKTREINMLVQENRIQAALLKQRDELLKDMCDEEDACRILLAKWDKSDSYGVVPLSDVVEVAITMCKDEESTC